MNLFGQVDINTGILMLDARNSLEMAKKWFPHSWKPQPVIFLLQSAHLEAVERRSKHKIDNYHLLNKLGTQSYLQIWPRHWMVITFGLVLCSVEVKKKVHIYHPDGWNEDRKVSNKEADVFAWLWHDKWINPTSVSPLFFLMLTLSGRCVGAVLWRLNVMTWYKSPTVTGMQLWDFINGSMVYSKTIYRVCWDIKTTQKLNLLPLKSHWLLHLSFSYSDYIN